MAGQPDKLDFRSDTFRPYATAIGEMALAWNDLHETLKGLFWASSGIPNGIIAYSIWYSSKSDRAQRDMLRALAATKALGNAIPHNIKPEIIWLVGQVDKLEDFRNDVLHSPFLISDGETVSPSWQSGHRRAKKLADKNLLKEIDWFYDASLVIRDYAWELDRAIRVHPEPLPKRPKLRNRGETSGRKSRRPNSPTERSRTHQR
ncbi:MAG: hypothetical protein JJ899_01735 [Alphaproteobacteria bacterium]|nr:hypothetical protein [Alphaproteobacteria bacterium]